MRQFARLLGAVGLGLLIAVNLWLAMRSLDLVLRGAPAVDWAQYVEAGQRILSGEHLYEDTWTYGYRYSPVLAYAFSALGALGEGLWRVLHIVAVLSMPSWRMVAIAALSWPFWYDVETGNTITFVVLAAAWAIRGSDLATGTYLALLLLIPRPLAVPVAAWLLWKRPRWRVPFVAMFVIHAGAVLATGWGHEWLAIMLASPEIYTSPTNLSPSRFIGLWWMVVAIPLAIWLTIRGRLGWASLAASPYLHPYYWLMAVLEVAPRSHGRDARSDDRLARARSPSDPVHRRNDAP